MNAEYLLKVANDVEKDPFFQSHKFVDINLPEECQGCAVARIFEAAGGVIKRTIQLNAIAENDWEALDWEAHWKDEVNVDLTKVFGEIMEIEKNNAIKYVDWTCHAPKEKIVKSLRMMAEGKWNFDLHPTTNLGEYF
jgi:hypothetical protein